MLPSMTITGNSEHLPRDGYNGEPPALTHDGHAPRSLLADYFLFLPLPPPLPPDAGEAFSTKPCVAPPPPFLRFPPVVYVDRSLFLSHRSGSGIGVTPSTTPLGTRLLLTFFSFLAVSVSWEAIALARVAAADVGCGGGADSRLFNTDAGRSSRARR